MWGLFNPENRFIRGLEGFYHLIFLSSLWLIGSLTVIGAGPSSVALYYAVSKSVKRGRSYPGREFWRAWKENWKSGAAAGIVILLFGLSVYLTDLPRISEIIVQGYTENMGLAVVAFAKVFLLVGMALYVFPVLSRFQVGAGKALGVSFVLIFRHLASTLLMMGILAVFVFLAVLIPVFVFLLPGLFLFLCTYPMEWIMQQHMEDAEKETDLSRDQWYLER